MTTPSLEELAESAVAGDRDSIAAVVRGIQGKVYGLALRVLWKREAAEDATQEILIRVVTRLSQFDRRSRLDTWVYRVATNYLIDVKRSCVEREQLTFARFAEDLASDLSEAGPADAEHSLLVEEVKLGCTLAMLQCLDRAHRLAYILGEILELSAPEAAEIMEIEPAALRKRLERAREQIEAFTRAHCGLVAEGKAPPCQCNRRVPAALRLGRARGDQLAFAATSTSFAEARATIQRVEQAKRMLTVYRSTALRAPAVDFVRQVVSALEP